MMENKDVTFETALERLEEIVRSLESGTTPLDSSLGMFEEGVALVKFCGKQLDTAEQKIKILTKNQDGEYEQKPFGTNEA